MDLQLAGKSAIVTGASKGIGFAIAQALAEEGMRVVAGARNSTEDLRQLAERLPVHFIPVDLSTPDGPARFIEEAMSTLIDLALLINNVGAAHPRLGGFHSISDDQWYDALNINFLAAVRTTRAALPHLLSRGAGAIVTICSVNAVLPDPLVIDYSAAKAALANFSKSLSKEVGPHGIRVNTISPGPVTTDLWLGKDGVAQMVAGATGGEPDNIARQAAAGTVTGRFTHPQEVADLALLLASDRTGNVTGADFVIDGGMITTI